MLTFNQGTVQNIDGNNSLQLYKYGNLCLLYGYVIGSNMNMTRKAILKYKPRYDIIVPCASDGGMTGYAYINTAGELYVKKTNGVGDNSSALRIHAVYVMQ